MKVHGTILMRMESTEVHVQIPSLRMKWLREALLRSTLFAAPDLKGYNILIRDFIREEILTAWHWSAPHLFRRTEEIAVPAAISS